MAKTNDISFSTDRPQTEKGIQEKQSKVPLQKLLSQEKIGNILGKEENIDHRQASKEENVGHIGITEDEQQSEVIGHIGAKEEKEVKAKRINYTPLDWGQSDNISDFIVDMMSGNLADWVVNNTKFAGQYADIAAERINNFNKKIEHDKTLQQVSTINNQTSSKQTGLHNNIQKYADTKQLSNTQQKKQSTSQTPLPNLIQANLKNNDRS